MRIALISDVHGNIMAFEAVMKTLKVAAADLTVFLGDLASCGLYPSECLSLLLSVGPLLAVGGNADDLLDASLDLEARDPQRRERLRLLHAYARERLRDDEIKTVTGFPPSAELETDGVRVGFFHGSPVSCRDRIYEDFPDEEVEEKFRNVRCTVAAVGHTHQRMHRTFGAIEIVNPGAVGFSFDGDTRAGCGILTLENGIVRYEQKNVGYPVERYAAEMRNSDFPFADDYADQLLSGESNREYVLPHGT